MVTLEAIDTDETPRIFTFPSLPVTAELRHKSHSSWDAQEGVPSRKEWSMPCKGLRVAGERDRQIEGRLIGSAADCDWGGVEWNKSGTGDSLHT